MHGDNANGADFAAGVTTISLAAEPIQYAAEAIRLLAMAVIGFFCLATRILAANSPTP